ncbi:hypothetical protein MUY35_15120 [Aliiroseovarius sp. S1339]|uniref:hypothetical protein n=1 Tax=Aliiroseovarius sp. S1339 TaxID=2936990 RepID=UPI0020BE8395|nr:hypothetical protein [Aliiroseovarius sp. S1339]MCK8465189.1 hypothetical protein [Aliiroseovarius sp. S1339]
MGNDNKNDDCQIRPAVDLRPFASALRHIEQGEPEKVDPVDIASELREHEASELPPELLGWICDYLEGSIETRGRKGESPLERRVVGLHAAHCYDAIRKAQKGDPDALPEAVSMNNTYAPEVEDSYSPSEAAWMIVSYMLYGQPGHHKKLRNLAGAAKSPNGKSARK